MLSRAAIGIFIVGLLATLFSLGGGMVLLVVGASFMTTAFWMGLLAQVMHIRANTSKP